MTKIVLAALAIGALAPSAAQGGTVVASARNLDGATASRPSTESAAVVALSDIGQLGAHTAPVPMGFSLTGLTEGVDRVLSSVDDDALEELDPFGDGTGAFAGMTVRRAGLMTPPAAAYDSADVTTEPLPEPATWLMMILGFFGLSFAVRRRATSSGDRVRFS